MNEQHREVQAWLEQQYGGDAVPQYEMSPHTLDLLYQLMQRSQRQEEHTAAIIAQYQRHAEEYAAESERISAILQQLGLHSDSLSQSGNTSLRTLSAVASLLQVKDASNTSLLLSLSELSTAHLRLAEQRRAEQRLTDALFTKTKSALLKANTLNKVLQNVEEEQKFQIPALAKKQKQASFLASKSKEYSKHIQHMQVELTKTGVDPSIHHPNLTKKAQELQNLKDQLMPLKAKLDSYHKLPANLTLAKVEVEAAKQELASLEAELAKHIDLMHL